MTRTLPQNDRAQSFVARLARLLAAIDSTVEFYGRHRAWPANEPIRVDPPR